MIRSSFFEFHVAGSALFTAKAALQVIGHNTANESTKGYSRQYVEQRATRPLATYNHKGMVGTGSEVFGVGQHRSFYLDKKYWSENSVLGEYSTKNSEIKLTQTIFNELSETGLQGKFDEFFKVLQDATTNTPDRTYRNGVIKSASALADHVNATAASLRKQQQGINSEVASMVTLVNTIGDQIANLNRQISKAEYDGSRANDLRDQRALLVDELSQYVNVQVEEVEMNPDFAAGKYPNSEDRGRSDKRFSVSINGYEFVNHWDVTNLKVVAREDSDKRNAMDAEGLYDIEFENGVQFNLYSTKLKGELKGLIDMRDGNNNAPLDASGNPLHPKHQYKGIPHYLEELNTLVRTVSRAMNAGLDHLGQPIPGIVGHENGVDGYDNQNGQSLFTFLDNNGNELATLLPGSYNNMNCFNFKVNDNIINDEMLLACSDVPNSGESNNNIIHQLGDIAKYQSLFREGKLGDFISGVTGELAVDGKQAKNFYENYTNVSKTIDNQRKQVSGVNLNEETLAMIQYQVQYQNAVKLINVINDMYDNIINRMGV